MAKNTIVLEDGITIERKPNHTENLIKGWTVVWSPDGDYDAWYPMFDTTGVEQEVAFIRHHLASQKASN